MTSSQNDETSTHGRAPEVASAGLFGDLDRLIAAACNASFDCGEWRAEESADDYDYLLDKSLLAKRQLRERVANALRRLISKWESRQDALAENERVCPEHCIPYRNEAEGLQRAIDDVNALLADSPNGPAQERRAGGSKQ